MTIFYVVYDSYEGGDKLFEYEDDAIEFINKVKLHLHTKYCIDKTVPDKCLCSRTKGEKTCASHHYAQNIQEHDLDSCQLAEDSVFLEEKPVY